MSCNLLGYLQGQAFPSETRAAKKPAEQPPVDVASDLMDSFFSDDEAEDRFDESAQ